MIKAELKKLRIAMIRGSQTRARLFARGIGSGVPRPSATTNIVDRFSKLAILGIFTGIYGLEKLFELANTGLLLRRV